MKCRLGALLLEIGGTLAYDDKAELQWLKLGAQKQRIVCSEKKAREWMIRRQVIA